MWRSNRGPLAAAAFLAVALWAGAGPAGAATGSLTVRWDANTTDADLSGYRVYLSTDPAIFSLTPAAARPLATTRTVAASVTETTFASLPGPDVHYVAVTSLDTSGNESRFSKVASGTPAQSAAPPAARSSQRDILVGEVSPADPRPASVSAAAFRSPAP